MGETEINLAKIGDKEAIERIMRSYKGFICKNSRLFYLNGGDSEDLEQEGYIGLIKAIRYFDCKKCDNFDVFAHLCIKRQILTAIKKSNNIGNQGLNNAILQDETTICDSENNKFEKSIEFYTPEEIILGKEMMKLLYIFLKNNLSREEKRVLRYVIKGYTYKDIAEKLSENPKKIDNCIQRVKKKILMFVREYKII